MNECPKCGGSTGTGMVCLNCSPLLASVPAAGSDGWAQGYAQGHQKGYQRGMADALPLPTDIIAIRVPCNLTFMLAIMKAVGRKYPKARMRQVGQWTHFTEEELDLGMGATWKAMQGNQNVQAK